MNACMQKGSKIKKVPILETHRYEVSFLNCCLYVCMHFCQGSLCDCVHAKGQNQLSLGERSLKGVLLSQPREITWLMAHC